MGTLKPDFLEADFLFDWVEGDKPVVFVLGSAISMGVVPSAAGMVERVREVIPSRHTQRFEDAVAGTDNPYQAAFGLLTKIRGVDATNKIIQDAVLDARVMHDGLADKATEDDLDGWKLTNAHRGLARWIVEKQRDVTIVTTNFDPLIEVAIRQAGGDCFARMFSHDGNLLSADGQGTQVVHVHGFWRGDMLHTTAQLEADRPFLNQSLQALFRGRVAVVLGYGGWDDVITRALWAQAYDVGAKTDVLWGFYEADEAKAFDKNPQVFKGFQPTVPGRFQPIAGVDVHRFFLDLAEMEPPPPPPEMLTPEEIEQVIDWALQESLTDQRRSLTLSNMPARLVKAIPPGKSPFDQLTIDLTFLNDPAKRVRGRLAMAIWLANAKRMSIRPACTGGFERLRERIEGEDAPAT